MVWPTALVSLDWSELLLAVTWERVILGTGLERTDNYTGITREGRFNIGYIGEIAFRKLLDNFDVRYVHSVNLEGRSQEAPEFRASEGGNVVRIELKTAGCQGYSRMMFPPGQLDPSATYVVGARIEKFVCSRALVCVAGYLTHAEAAALPLGDFGKGPSHNILLEKLRPIGDLLWRLDKRQVVVPTSRESTPADQSPPEPATPAT